LIWNKNYWEWFAAHVWNGGDQVSVGFNIQGDLTANQTMAMAVYPNGELHVYADGKDVGTPWKNLPVDLPLYGVIGLENLGVSYGSFQLGECMMPAIGQPV
jgi:hypothetical protein